MSTIQCLHRVWRACLAALFALAFSVGPGTAAHAQDASASGEVRRVDAAGGKVTLIHGAIPDLQLPAMTLVYQAPSDLLQGLQPGDKVKFSARRENNAYVITAISK